MFPLDDTISVHTVDLLGNGKICIVWSTSTPSLTQQQFRCIDLNKGKKPHLLSKIINNLGAKTALHYAPSTKFYLDDLEKGDPWVANVPFPVHCVEKVKISDKISQVHFVRRFNYHHGYLDGTEREFRGFAGIEELDTDSFAAMRSRSSANIDACWHVPPVRTTTWFHTGVFVGGDTWSQQLSREYFSASPEDTSGGGVSGPLLPDSIAPGSGLSTDALRECYRALKGRILRKGVYGEVASDKATIPYLIQENNYAVKVVQGAQDSHQHSVCSVFPRESISCQMERDPSDARIEHSFALAYSLNS
ncbi:insecticide toxin TcdB middle/N-terminal region-domain-containing protein [Fusarium flagelliforme]|uniref:insecticide toxin TcdB middle/N-terminal region-domain-containing protein n=1 Tax=Fusarium flagelliforme TaxID=2675880 RepID=UPI001E8E3283|nr:insecticide toxin TcdB middle/N-terminal region-domain-containing protein [Fusarium flagelliforme]KAH7179083.1 insecticide toxin TcdB middle/N-terminal region-domain-containing protein [Fusarium flagelliforme]